MDLEDPSARASQIFSCTDKLRDARYAVDLTITRPKPSLPSQASPLLDKQLVPKVAVRLGLQAYPTTVQFYFLRPPDHLFSGAMSFAAAKN